VPYIVTTQTLASFFYIPVMWQYFICLCVPALYLLVRCLCGTQ